MATSTSGVSSGLDVNSIVSQLMAIEQRPLAKLAQKEASYQAKVSAFGSVSSALSTFQDALGKLADPAKYQGMSASVGDATILTASAGTKAAAGSYNINVTQLPQAQTLKSAGMGSSTAKIGTGAETTITFQFGSYDTTAASDGVYPDGTKFTQSATRTTGTIKIDGTNNSLQGIRDAINKAGLGVTATIISDGSATPNRLVLTSDKTGAASNMKIAVSGDTALQDLLAFDPTTAGGQKMTQAAAGQNALLTVNGISISSETKSVSDAIQGVTLNVLKAGSTTFSVSKDSAQVTNTVTSFVKAYNDLQSTLKQLTSYNTETKAAGILLGDPTIRSLQTSMRQMLGASNDNAGSLKTLSAAGISFQKDGTLALDNSKLQKAVSGSPEDLAALFSTVGRASDSLISVTGSKASTKAGKYDVSISNLPKQGYQTGDAALSGPVTIAAGTTLNVALDGVSAKVGLTAGSYAPQELVAMMQAAINGTSAFSSAGNSVAVSLDEGGRLKVTSNRYGPASKVAITDDAGTGIATLFGAVITKAEGEDVAGSIGGMPAAGNGQVLTGATNTAVDGLKIQVNGGTTGPRGSIDFSTGIAGQLSKTIESYLGSSGMLKNRTDGLNRTIKDIDKSRTALNTRLAETEKRLRAEYVALDSLLTSMAATSNYLTQQLASLSALK
ncbi:flagellar filament capping protein FliD [Noviherbaspirillum aridicola]|uniref:flagellar filament capping protein FliD n=1 Tax=Noviherbaspirillum aridicola TaxID=2849687 RepID=UPI001C81EFE7|nr:flagellar filament capping protein FliD [Noviherbaspirillum aridicola]